MTGAEPTSQVQGLDRCTLPLTVTIAPRWSSSWACPCPHLPSEHDAPSSYRHRRRVLAIIDRGSCTTQVAPDFTSARCHGRVRACCVLLLCRLLQEALAVNIVLYSVCTALAPCVQSWLCSCTPNSLFIYPTRGLKNRNGMVLPL